MNQPDGAVVRETRPPPKHYRRPRRRPAHLRTKTGCLTCRKRKKKCDETRFICQNCARGSYACVWPVEGNGTTRGGRHQNQLSSDEDTFTGFSSTDSPGSACIGGSQSDESMTVALRRSPQCFLDDWNLDTTPFLDDDLSLSIYTPTISFSPAITPDSIPLFDFLRTVFLRQLIRPMADGSVIEAFNTEGLRLAFNTPYFMHALLACCGAEIPLQNPSHFQRIGEKHYAKAVAGLRTDLAAGNHQNKLTVILRAVIILCIYERSKPRLSRGVDVHLLGAAQLIKLYFHRDSFQPSLSQTESVTQRLILEAFVFHTATSVPFQQPAANSALIDSAFSLAEYRLETFFHPEPPLYDGSPVLGVPPKFFRYIREVALMYQKYPVEGVDVVRCCELEYALRQWDKHASAKFLKYGDVGLQNQSPSTVDFFNINTPQLSTNALLLGPRLYVLAARILLNRMTSLDAVTANPCYHTLVSEAMLLVSQLQPSSDYFAEYYGWPFLVLGTSVINQLDRDCLMSQIRAFWEATRNGTMRRLMDMLSACWETGDNYV